MWTYIDTVRTLSSYNIVVNARLPTKKSPGRSLKSLLDALLYIKLVKSVCRCALITTIFRSYNKRVSRHVSSSRRSPKMWTFIRTLFRPKMWTYGHFSGYNIVVSCACATTHKNVKNSPIPKSFSWLSS